MPVTGPISGAWSVYQARDELSDTSQAAVVESSGIDEADFGSRLGAGLLGTTTVDDVVTITGDQYDDTSDSYDEWRDDPLGLVPWWAKYAVGGVGLLAVLVALRPYASIGAGVVS